MPHETFTALLEKLGIPQAGAARLFAVNVRTARRWCTGEWPVPPAVALCLILMDRQKISGERAAKLLAEHQ